MFRWILLTAALLLQLGAYHFGQNEGGSDYV